MAKYSYKLKNEIVQSYLNGEGGYAYLAEKYKIRNKDGTQVKKWINNLALITKWVNYYRVAGIDALLEKSKGRKSIMPKLIKDNNTNYVKQLEDALLKLRIENAYLKELRKI